MFLDDKLDNTYKYFYRSNNNSNIITNSNTITNSNIINLKQNVHNSIDNTIKNINKLKRIYQMNKFKKK